MGDDLCVAEVQEWADGLAELRSLIGWRFARSEPREHAIAYVRGLLSAEERKNSWTLSERAGNGTPDGMQRLLSTTDWDPHLVRDDLQRYVVDHLGDPGGVLIIDETGFLKKGTRSAGVARQYSGTAGRIENSQIGVFLTYSTAAGRTFLDRELYLPKGWTEDRERCAHAGIGEDVGFATKPELAMMMLQRAHDNGVPARWATADEVYGQHARLRAKCEELGLSYVLAVGVNQHMIAGPGQREGQEFRSDALIAALPVKAWRTYSAGKGAKGDRRYDWARVDVDVDVELTAVDGRTLTFAVQAHEDAAVISRGTHRRTVITPSRFNARLRTAPPELNAVRAPAEPSISGTDLAHC